MIYFYHKNTETSLLAKSIAPAVAVLPTEPPA